VAAEEEKDVSAEEPKDGEKAAAKAAAKKPAAKKAAKEPKAEGDKSEKAPAKKAAKEPKAEGGKAKAEGGKAKKAPAKKAAAEDEQAGPDAQQDTVKTAAKKATAKKAAAAKAASPGDSAEAQEAAKAQDAEKPSKKAGRRAAEAVKPAARRKVVRARARYVRTSARKARMVCGHLRGKSVQEARAILAFTPRGVARDWSKLLESAVANAESNHELLEDDLVVREAYADEGPTIKRFRPRAMGRATPIRKRTSHLTITLTPRPDGANRK
jgi:ribosomal protein L22